MSERSSPATSSVGSTALADQLSTCGSMSDLVGQSQDEDDCCGDIKRHETIVASAGAKFRGSEGTVILTDSRILWHPLHIDENSQNEEICLLDDINHSSQDDSSDSESDDTASVNSAVEEGFVGLERADRLGSTPRSIPRTASAAVDGLAQTPTNLTINGQNRRLFCKSLILVLGGGVECTVFFPKNEASLTVAVLAARSSEDTASVGSLKGSPTKKVGSWRRRPRWRRKRAANEPDAETSVASLPWCSRHRFRELLQAQLTERVRARRAMQSAVATKAPVRILEVKVDTPDSPAVEPSLPTHSSPPPTPSMSAESSTQQHASDQSHTAPSTQSARGQSPTPTSDSGRTSTPSKTEVLTIAGKDFFETSRKITTTGIHIGERVILRDTSNFAHQRGTLRFCGAVHFQLGETCGIELDIPGGMCSGTVHGVRYFWCPTMHGAFVGVNDIMLESKAIRSPEKKSSDTAGGGAASSASGGEPRRRLLLPRPKWDEHTRASQCFVCKHSFGTLLRRHHCRNCGILCCNKCSSHKTPIPYLAYFDPERVCDFCYPYVDLFSRASCVVARQDRRVGMDKSPEARLQQLSAIDEIVRILESSDALQLAHCSVVELLVMLSLLPPENIKVRALQGVWKLAEYGQLHDRFVAAEGIAMLVTTLRKDTDGEILVFAASALALVCENPKHRTAALSSGVLEVLLLHVSQPYLRMQLIVSETIAGMLQERAYQERICSSSDGEHLLRLLASVITVDDARYNFKARASVAVDFAEFHHYRSAVIQFVLVMFFRLVRPTRICAHHDLPVSMYTPCVRWRETVACVYLLVLFVDSCVRCVFVVVVVCLITLVGCDWIQASVFYRTIINDLWRTLLQLSFRRIAILSRS
eukprot:m.1469496 g.1469496  ORF g.1469496 m.1469496 type:complete len:873 (-) comp25143_c0_seq4:42-2660(-)